MSSVHAQRTLAMICTWALLGAAPSRAQDNFIVHGILPTGLNSGDAPITDATLRVLLNTELNDCAKKLLLLTQCYGGEFLDEFVGATDVAIASATGPSEVSFYGYYDAGAAFGLRPDDDRTAQDLHSEASVMAHAQETPHVGGALGLDNFSLDLRGSDQQRMHILYYAAQPLPPDRDYLYFLYEVWPEADIVVVSDGLLDPEADFEPNYTELRAALIGIRGRMLNCDHQFVMFVSDHGQLSFHLLEEDAPEGEQTEVDTPEVPEQTGQDLLGTPDPDPVFVIFIPLFGTGITVDPEGDPLFEPGEWRVSIPVPGGPLVLTQFTLIPVALDEGLIGDDPGEGIRIEFPMSVAEFIASFVGHANTVTITNNGADGRTWTIEVILDPGPIQRIEPPPPCLADFDGDGFVTGLDFDAYVAAFEAGEESADFDFDGFVTGLDFDAYVVAFEAGC